MTRDRTSPPRVDDEVSGDYKIDVSKLDASVLVRITRMAFRHRLRMFVAIVATLLCAASAQLLVPQYLGQAVDQAKGLLFGAAEGAVERSIAEEALLTTALLLLAAAIMRGLCTMMQNYQGKLSASI